MLPLRPRDRNAPQKDLGPSGDAQHNCGLKGQEWATLAIAGTEFARLQATTLRAKLLIIGAVVLRNTRRLRVLSSRACP